MNFFCLFKHLSTNIIDGNNDRIKENEVYNAGLCVYNGTGTRISFGGPLSNLRTGKKNVFSILLIDALNTIRKANFLVLINLREVIVSDAKVFVK